MHGMEERMRKRMRIALLIFCFPVLILEGCDRQTLNAPAHAPVETPPPADAAPPTDAESPPVAADPPAADSVVPPKAALPPPVRLPPTRGPVVRPTERGSTQEVGSSNSSAQPATPDDKTVYNVELWPQLPNPAGSRAQAVLIAGKSASLRFDIGPKWPSLDSIAMEPNTVLTNSSVDIPLTVVLVCGFCEPKLETTKRTKFIAAERRASEIRFDFKPRRKSESVYADVLRLLIMNDETGLVYDSIPIAVEIRTSASQSAARTGVMTIESSATPDAPNWQADVILYATANSDRNVTVEFEPVSDAMKKAIGSLAYNGPSRKKFRTSINDVALVQQMTNTTYNETSSVSLQNDDLALLGARADKAIVSPESRATLKLTAEEAAGVNSVLASTGRRLYRRFFSNSGDKNLLLLVQKMEQAARAHTSRPARMRIVTDSLSVPWQYFHPLGKNISGEKFWGMLFSLSVERGNNNATFSNAPDDPEPANAVLFAKYGNDKDPSVALADLQTKQLIQIPNIGENLVIPVSRGRDFLDKLRANRLRVAAIVTFLHASAGSDAESPHLQFNENDRVTGVDLEDLLNTAEESEQERRFLSGSPLVFLNACETGPARILPHVKLENSMFQLGASSVIVTEVSVWIPLGHEVATQLIDRLGKGEQASDALTYVRRHLLKEKNNPLGLLYAYYGNPAATLVPH